MSSQLMWANGRGHSKSRGGSEVTFAAALNDLNSHTLNYVACHTVLHVAYYSATALRKLS